MKLLSNFGRFIIIVLVVNEVVTFSFVIKLQGRYLGSITYGPMKPKQAGQ